MKGTLEVYGLPMSVIPCITAKAIADLLIEKGIISREEYHQRLSEVAIKENEKRQPKHT